MGCFAGLDEFGICGECEEFVEGIGEEGHEVGDEGRVEIEGVDGWGKVEGVVDVSCKYFVFLFPLFFVFFCLSFESARSGVGLISA